MSCRSSGHRVGRCDEQVYSKAHKSPDGDEDEDVDEAAGTAPDEDHEEKGQDDCNRDAEEKQRPVLNERGHGRGWGTEGSSQFGSNCRWGGHADGIGDCVIQIVQT